MRRQQINTVAGIAPIVMSLAAFTLATMAALTGWEQGQADEGTGAHIFQFLIAAQVPVILLFLATADWKQTTQVIRLLIAQALALVAAFGPVAFFRM